MKFAFIIMGEFNSKSDIAFIHDKTASIIGVSSVEEAQKIAKKLLKEGIDCIELCGAFGEKGAEEIIKATENKIPIGYVTHLKKQEEIYKQTFGKQ